MEKPKIRFKGYQEDWEQRKLGDITVKIGSGKTPSGGKSAYVETGIPLIRSQNVNGDKVDFADIVFIDEATDESMANSRVYTNDVLLNITGASIGRSAVYKGLESANVNQHVCIIRPTEGYQPDFIQLNLSSDNGQKQIDASQAGGGREGLNFQEIGKIQFYFPSLNEQKCIGRYFNSLDHLITLHQRKCEEMKTLKKYMLQKMFPQNGQSVPQIRFSGFTEDWEQRKLGDFGKATGGTSIESEFSEDGIYKVISIGSYSENGVYNDQGIRAIKSDKTSNRVLNRNDLTMILNDKTTSGNIIGRVLLIEESGIYVYNQRTERIEINLDEYDPVFLYEMLNAPNIREKIIKQAQGNTQIYVNWIAISLLEYMIPSKEEQVKIGEYLHSISNLITLHQQKCDELRNIKKFMLQNMFI